MTGTIHVVDYGIGNLYSVARAIERSGGTACLTSAPAEIGRADRLILPGVGAFRDGMAGLRHADVTDAIARFAASGRPLMGICLGMQMLATSSSEFGFHEGMGIIPGRVEAIPPKDANGRPRKVPYIGWAELHAARTGGFADTLFNDMAADHSVYLVHSYQFLPDNPADLLATYHYDGEAITAAVARDNVIGCQFHPEKSARVGLRMIERFLAL